MSSPLRPRRARWPRPGRTIVTVEDGVGRLSLEQVALRLADRAPAIVRARAQVEFGPVGRGEYHDESGNRAWRSPFAHRTLWCALDPVSQTVLLELVLGGPPSAVITAVERSILTEAICRLFEGSEADRVSMRETKGDRPAGDLWRCNVDLAASGKKATLQLFVDRIAPPPPPTAPLQIDVGDVALHVRAETEPVSARLHEVAAWSAGSLIPLDLLANQLAARLTVGSVALARGRLGSAGPRRAVQITNLDAPWPG